ncbi:hypothetical protein HETIRDRAFT_460753 [Heterobasidion irregulare TC 32-1]|uniref:Spindle assembly checkpoint component MAD1 n=1 Tax=Heterobasidion irregulare (strain TC 32-1) TaxID=747525 RepID=W4JS27_HETIT|nr:uncharacterized protein HETIRDRAFT_460753 [Heterobasidion irregulare TC 32-1]ETW76357.1 hypothetical protein HETIRDRAFT_460753 [Heterobasidion irregulare TC 32-1]
MNSNKFTAPIVPNARLRSSAKPSATKRDSLVAELERDPQLSTAKRQQRTQAFTSTMAHASLERQLVAAQTTKMELESKLREKDMAIERLEEDRRWLAEREKEEREEKEKEQAGREEEKRKAEHELRALRSAHATLREEHANLEEAHEAMSRNTAQTIASQKSQIAALTRQVSFLDAELASMKRLADERSATIEEIQMQMEDLSSAQLDVSRHDIEQEDWGVLREELQRQASYLRTLEGTNAKLNSELIILRERQDNVEVIREEKRSLEGKLRVTEQLREQVTKLEAEVQAARHEREEWAKRATQLDTPSKTPVSISQSLSALRLAHAKLLEEHGANVALLRRREADLTDAQDRDVEKEEALEDLQREKRVLLDKIAHLERDAALAEREVGFLQALNASYSAEQSAQGADSIDKAKDEQIRQLESLLQDYKSRTQELEGELDELSHRPLPATEKQGPRLQELKEALEKDRQALKEVQKALDESEVASEQQLEQIEELEQTLFELRGEIGAGRHVPPGVRILSLKDNPAQQWSDLRQEVMDRLKGENEALINRLKELEDSGAGQAAAAKRGDGPGEDLVPRRSWEVVNQEKHELEEVVKQKEKRLLRLQQVFTAKSTEFREAIAAIMGVKLAFYPNGQVRVTSQYDLNASFVFQPTSRSEGAKMQLIAQGEGGPQELPQLMRNWVEEEQCIPCFLASVTLECYDTWKREQALGLS